MLTHKGTPIMKTIFPLCLILSLMFVTFVSASENTNNVLVSGSFGIAWLDSDGVVHLYDGTKVTEPVPDVKVYAILAADLLEEGSDQLAYLDDGRKALRIYSFKTQQTIGPFGHNVRTLAAGRCAPDETFPSLFVSTFSGASFRWTKEVMNAGWINIPGDFVQAAGGRFDRRSSQDDFATVNGEGDVYLYSTMWQTYSKVAGVKNITAVLAGNFTASPGDEVALFDKEGSVFLYQNRTLENLGQKAACLAAGRNSERLDTLYAIDKEGKIVRYDRETKTWKKLPAGNNLVFTNLIVKDEQTLFAVSNGNLYKITGDKAEQLSSVLPTSIVLQKGGTPLARYRYVSVPFKPYIDELRTPSGKNILRDAPWDHLHHHALMYAVRVGGHNFWEEADPNAGKQITRKFQSAGNALETEIDWIVPQSKHLLKETRKISVEPGNNVTLLDWQGTLNAVEDTVLGTEGTGHYHGLGMRFDETMDKGGRFFNSTGKNDGATVNGDERLTPCRWMAYTAKLNGQPVTVALFDHPSNPVPMTVFTMGDAGGAFAYMSATVNLHRKPVELKAGQSFVAKYRVAVWDGEVTPEIVEKTYTDFVR
jgi:hypothetical protein